MQERAFLSRPTFLVAGALIGLWILSPGLAHAVLSKDDQKCVNEVNKNIEKVGKAVNKDISKCLKDGQKGDLSGTIEECITSDLKKKVLKATDKLDTKVSDKCLSDPNFPPINTADTAGMNTRSIQKEYDLAHAIFGNPIDAAAADFATQKDDAKCQQSVYKQAAKCQSSKLKSYNKCKKDGLKGTTPPGLITSAQQLEDACLNDAGTIPDGKGKILKDCDTKLNGVISGKCAGNLNLFPGCPSPANTVALLDCIDAYVECEVCLLLNEIDGLNRNCDDFDDGQANASCGFTLNHFKDYELNPDNFVTDVPVSLKDQFYDDPNARIESGPEGLWVPVQKTLGGNVTPILDPNAFLTQYNLDTDLPDGRFSVTIRNQFGVQSFALRGPSSSRLMVPARKDTLGPSATLDHYRCYRSTRNQPWLNLSVSLQDMFDPNHLAWVEDLTRLCTPVDKNGGGIKNPNEHLTCYDLRPDIFVNSPANVGDQFDPNNGAIVGESDELCVPSLKLQVGVCGDAVVEAAEECDPPTESACPGLCRSNCFCAPLCENDPNRTVFVEGGGAGSSDPNAPGSCRQFADLASCEDAWHVTLDGVAASCFWDPNNNNFGSDPNDPTDDCFGCGPNNFGNGNCTNTCFPAPSCADVSRITAAGGPGLSACRGFGDQTSCEEAWHVTRLFTGASCFWDGSECLGCGKRDGAECTNTCKP